MALTTEEIASHPALHGIIRKQSQAMLETYGANPRLASVFATQQRWLMGHAGLALYFRWDPRTGRGGFNAARFFDIVREHSVASRNTADAFIKEMLKYNFVHYVPGSSDKRIRPMEPAKVSIDTLAAWAAAHLTTLDALDGGRRIDSFLAGAAPLAGFQPLIADGLLTSKAVREPQRTFSLFTWLNNGGVVMDWLIAGIEPAAADVDRIPTGVLSVADMAAWLKLSRTHLARKLREAEAMGSIGWEGKRGNSVMWVSKEFRAEYAMAQAVKLAIIDAAFEACLRAGKT
jgi:hypothetical protein